MIDMFAAEAWDPSRMQMVNMAAHVQIDMKKILCGEGAEPYIVPSWGGNNRFDKSLTKMICMTMATIHCNLVGSLCPPPISQNLLVACLWKGPINPTFIPS